MHACGFLKRHAAATAVPGKARSTLSREAGPAAAPHAREPRAGARAGTALCVRPSQASDGEHASGRSGAHHDWGVGGPPSGPFTERGAAFMDSTEHFKSPAAPAPSAARDLASGKEP